MSESGAVGCQLRLDPFPGHEPFACPFEASVADIGGGKSFCEPWGRWTNCREAGYCVRDERSDGE